METYDPTKLPLMLVAAEADTLYGRPAQNSAKQLVFEREMAELADKMVFELLLAFDDQEIELDFSPESLEEIDRLADLTYPEPIEEDEALEALVSNWGAYLGITIIEQLGGAWVFRRELEHTAIHFPRLTLESYPMHVVRRRLMLGKGETLAGFYDELVNALTR
jgi:hypothetical protein